MAEIHLPVLGAEGQPCGSCGSPLAADQRYCLSCGWRRGAQRVDVERLLDDAAKPETAAAPVGPGGVDQKVWTPFAIVGSITVLGVMMLLGVLIGKDNGGTAPAAQSTPIVLDPNASSSAGGGETSKATADTSGGDEEKSKGGDKKDETVTEDAAVTDAVSALEGLEGPEYAKEAAKLPDTVAIPGDPPKPDGKDPGGGSDAITIE